MKYYDSTSGKIKETMEDKFVHSYYNPKIAKIRNILSLIAVILMGITVIIQIFWLNIIIYSILCSSVILLCSGMLICDIAQKDTKSIIHPILWTVIWLINLIVNLIN